jgi:hypothetical protein
MGSPSKIRMENYVHADALVNEHQKRTRLREREPPR